MEVFVLKDYEEVSKKAFEVMKSVVSAKPDAVLGLATGSTPLGLYRNMIQDHQENQTSYAQCQSFNLDEYVGLPRDHKESYYTFMHTNLFSGKKRMFTFLMEIPRPIAKPMKRQWKMFM